MGYFAEVFAIERKEEEKDMQSVKIKKTGLSLCLFIILILLYCLFRVRYNFALEDKTVKDINPHEVHKMMEDKDKKGIILLDVRNQSERNEGYIPGSIFIPITELLNRLNELNQYKDTTIVVYCQSGKRSAKASLLLIENGFKKVLNMDGGIIAWMTMGGKIIKGN